MSNSLSLNSSLGGTKETVNMLKEPGREDNQNIISVQYIISDYLIKSIPTTSIMFFRICTSNIHFF